MSKPKSQDSRVLRYDTLVTVIVLVIMVTFLLAALLMIENTNTNTRFKDRAVNYSDGWTIIEDDTREVVDLPARVKTDSDGVIVMSKRLPSNIPRNYALITRNYHQNIEVVVGGEVLYRYPSEERSKFLNLITDEWHLINLGPAQSTKTMEIRFIQGNGTSLDGYIQAVYYGEDNSLVHMMRTRESWALISGLTLVSGGLILVILGWIYRRYNEQRAQAIMGIVLICFGGWLAERSMMPLLSLNSDVKFFVGFLCLLLVPAMIFLYCYWRFDTLAKTVSRRAFVISLIYATVILLISIFGFSSLETMTSLIYGLALLAIIYTAVLLYRVSFGRESQFLGKNKLLTNRIEFIATLILPIGITIETIINSDQLWTEIGWLYRITINGFGLAYMVTVLMNSYYSMRNRAAISEKLHESQLELMMGQIQPHFIFNTLSSIRTLIKIDPDTAYNMIYDFSNYLRANVDNITNMEGIKFSAEVGHIKSYVNIEKVRFGDRLNVDYDIKVSDFVVPPLSIQPLVENAIKHGVCQRPEGGTVWLRSYSTTNYNIVEVEDDGVGFDQQSMANVFSANEVEEDHIVTETAEASARTLQEIVESSNLKDAEGNPITIDTSKRQNLSGNGSEDHESTGLRNISLRLREMADARMEITSQIGQGTKIRVLFPKSDTQ